MLTCDKNVHTMGFQGMALHYLEMVHLEGGLLKRFAPCCGRQLSVIGAPAAALHLPLSAMQLHGSNLRRSPRLKSHAFCRLHHVSAV